MYEVINNVAAANDIPYQQDLGSVMPKLTASFARLDFSSEVTKDNLDKSLDLWTELMSQARRTTFTTKQSHDPYQKTADDSQLLGEIQDMHASGIPLTFKNVLAQTKIPSWRFEDVLERLKVMGDIYFPKGDMIGMINHGKK